MSDATRPCAVCGEPLARRQTRFCSPLCASRGQVKAPCRIDGCEAPSRKDRLCAKHYRTEHGVRLDPKRHTKPATCEACGTVWDAAYKYTGRRACSTMCRTYLTYGHWPSCPMPMRRPTALCPYCQETFAPRNPEQRYCSRLCRAARVFVAGACSWCQAGFIAVAWHSATDRTRWCSPSCRRAHKRYERNARAGNGRAFTRTERLAVYERDGWTCHICGDEVNRGAVVPTLDAPVIDHVIPLAKGGAHDQSNWRTAHFYCNSYKRDLDLADVA